MFPVTHSSSTPAPKRRQPNHRRQKSYTKKKGSGFCTKDQSSTKLERQNDRNQRSRRETGRISGDVSSVLLLDVFAPRTHDVGVLSKSNRFRIVVRRRRVHFRRFWVSSYTSLSFLQGTLLSSPRQPRQRC